MRPPPRPRRVAGRPADPRRALAASACAVVLAGCGGDAAPPRETYYERNIAPILEASCTGNTSGCHRASPDDPYAFAAGNLDVTSFETLQERRDVLERFGAYPVPLLLVKAVGGTDELGISYQGEFRPLDVRHGGGAIFNVGSDAYLELLTWLENGATENGLPPASARETGDGPCSGFVPADFDDGAALESPEFGRFRDEVQPVLASCSAGNCHGAPQSDFYLTCGDTDRQLALNFTRARAFVADPVGNSQLLQMPLAVQEGGYVHTGGEHFASRADPDYGVIESWAESVGPVSFGADDPGKAFFRDHVQPLLVTRGCEFEACHSPEGTNDFTLRSGSQGFFSAVALEKNYELLRRDFMALEVPDSRRSRAVAKGLAAQFGGIAHRGGPVLETPGSGGSDPASCADPFDPATAPAFCVMQQWLEIEREELVSGGVLSPMQDGDTVPIVYVDRQEGHVASPLEFDTYQPGSDLMVADATLGAFGTIASVGESRSLLDECPGTGDRSVVDVSAPDVRHGGDRVAFALRTSADAPRQVFTVGIDGTGCTRVTSEEGRVSGILIHNFDPAWSPDGEWLVYASTRGTDAGEPAPTRSRKLLLPQSDLFRIRPDGSGREQMTILTNSEISPQFKREGRVIMTTEKVSPRLYQLSGRRINWDLSDYHPLLAQRAESPFGDPEDPEVVRPSVDYRQATEIRESFDGNFLLVLSDPGARAGAGTLATFNRSVGTFEAGRDDPGFLESMRIIDRAATGRVGEPTDGAYRSPFPLPDGRIMASYAATGADLGRVESLDFDVVAVDPLTGEREVLIGGAGAQVEAVLALERVPHEPYANRRQLVFGGTVDPEATGGEEHAVVHIPDAPLIFTLLNANLRRGRPVDLYRGATHLAVYEEKPAPPDADAPNQDGIYIDRELIGRAPLADDDSVKLRAPTGTGVILELQNEAGDAVVTMKEEHQFGPGSVITIGVTRDLFDEVCGGCHGSVTGRELDIGVTPDALTGASQSLSRDDEPADL